MREFRKLNIWNEAMDRVRDTYAFAAKRPPHEKFGMVSQMCRAAVSIPSNIAEGCSRSSEVEFKRFLEIALGSCFELETQILLSERLTFADKEEVDSIVEPLHTLQKRINALITKIKHNSR